MGYTKCKKFIKRLKKIEKISDPNESAQALSDLTQDMRQNGFEFPLVYRRTITAVRQLIEECATRTTSEKRIKGKVWVIIIILTTLTTLVLNLDKIKEMFRGETEKEIPSHKIVQQTMDDSPGGTQVAGDLYINETENILHKPIVVANATVEVKITSGWDFNGRVANTKAYLAFVKGDKPLLITSSIGYTASQTGNDEVVYKAKLDMDAKDSAVGNPASFLKDAEYIQIEFGRMPSDSRVLEGDAVCIINNSVRLEFSIPPQKLVNNRIFIRNLSESLRVLNEPGN